MVMLAVAFLYGLCLVIILTFLFLIGVQARSARRCIYNKPDCGCTTSTSTYYVHSAESRNGGAFIAGAAEDGRRLAALAKRPPDKVAEGR